MVFVLFVMKIQNLAKKANQLILNKKFDELKNLLKEKDISLKRKIWKKNLEVGYGMLTI